MTNSTTQTAVPTPAPIPESLAQRLESLGITAEQYIAQLQGAVAPLEEIYAFAAPFLSGGVVTLITPILAVAKNLPTLLTDAEQFGKDVVAAIAGAATSHQAAIDPGNPASAVAPIAGPSAPAATAAS